jgi:hypothetical protein
MGLLLTTQAVDTSMMSRAIPTWRGRSQKALFHGGPEA